MASALRFRAATGLLSRTASAAGRIQLTPCFASLSASSSSPSPRRLFSHLRALNAEIIVKIPQMAESISEGTLAAVPKQVGDRVEVDEEIGSVETDKIDVAVNTPEAGVILEYFAAEGDTVVVDQDFARIQVGGEAESSSSSSGSSSKKDDAPAKEESKSQEEKPKEEKPEEKKPEEKKPEEKKPDEKQSEKPAAPAPSKPSPAPEKPAAQQSQQTTSGSNRGERVEKLSRMRKTIASRLKQSQNTCASLTTVQEVDLTNLMAWRAKYREEVLEEHGVRLGYMGAFTKATTMAAQKVPQVNAAIDTDKEIITYRDYVDISIAVSAPKGLVTPVLRNTNEMSIVELEREVAVLAKKARDSKLSMADLEGGNFSISNPGIFGSMFGTPVINYPQATIFNMNGIQQRVMAVNGQAEIRPMMYITLTYDHRLIDGREAVTFLNLVKKYIEDPSRMLLA